MRAVRRQLIRIISSKVWVQRVDNSQRASSFLTVLESTSYSDTIKLQGCLCHRRLALADT